MVLPLYLHCRLVGCYACHLGRRQMAAVCKVVALLTVVIFSTAEAASLKCHPELPKQGSVCPRSASIDIRFKPYYEAFFDKLGSDKSFYPQILINASFECCNSSRLRFVAVNSSSDIEELINDESYEKDVHNDTSLTFFFPVFVKREQKVVFDDEFQFIQLTKSPGPVIIMLKSEKDKMKVTASVAIRESWPLFVLIISLSLTVGILGWLMDHSSNPSQFSSWFYKGAWEGFWWAMVTITTVGYGDKVPVAFFSRILTIVWMFCGAIILSLFTANVTSVLTSNQMDNTKNLIGRKIGVLNSKHYFESNLNVGGSIEEFNSQEEMFAKLMNGDVDRVLLPNYFDVFGLEANGGDKMALFSIVDVIYEPFLTGLALANKHYDSEKPFLKCLRKKIKMFNVFHGKTALPAQDQDSELRTTMLFQADIVEIIYYNLIAIGVIVGVGAFLDVVKCLRPKRKKKMSYTAEEIELKGPEANV